MMNSKRLLLSSLTMTASVVLGIVAACSDDPAVSNAADASSTADGSASDSSNQNDSSTDGSTPKGGVVGPVGLVYAGRFNGIDSRIVTALLDDNGALRGYDAGSSENIAAGTATVDGLVGDEFSSASRWINGTVTGTMYDDGGVKTLAANEGQHLGIALVTGTLPASGTVNYTLAGSSKPTLLGGSIAEGSVTSGSLTAQFAGNAGTRVGFTLNIAMAEGTFVVNGNGGSASVGDSGVPSNQQDAGFLFASPNLAVSTGAANCAPDAGTCPTTGQARVLFAGPNAERIVIAYSFGQRTGVVVFKK